MDKSIILSNLLCSGNYGIYNKFLAHKLGLVESIILSELIAMSDYINKNNLKDEFTNNGEFFFQQQRLADELSLNIMTVNKHIKSLFDKQIIIISKRGIPCKSYYKINYDLLADILSNQEMDKLVYEKPINKNVKKVEISLLKNNKLAYEKSINKLIKKVETSLLKNNKENNNINNNKENNNINNNIQNNKLTDNYASEEKIKRESNQIDYEKLKKEEEIEDEEHKKLEVKRVLEEIKRCDNNVPLLKQLFYYKVGEEEAQEMMNKIFMKRKEAGKDVSEEFLADFLYRLQVYGMYRAEKLKVLTQAVNNGELDIRPLEKKEIIKKEPNKLTIDNLFDDIAVHHQDDNINTEQYQVEFERKRQELISALEKEIDR